MERAIYITLMVILVLVVVAIFDAAALQRTWTGLSAGLLSFSFIFGNSIRQVCHVHVRSHNYAALVYAAECIAIQYVLRSGRALSMCEALTARTPTSGPPQAYEAP